MSQFSKFYEDIQERVRISDVVKRYVRIAKKGQEWQGLCPFHKEKTPSFTVNDQKEFYHCFGCAAHGNVINFVKEQEGIEYREAAERLANEYNIEIPKYTPQERQKQAEQVSLHDIMEQATNWFSQKLSREKLQYLIDRGITEQTIKHFRLGYSPDSYEELQRFFTAKKVKPADLLKVGLLSKNDRGKVYDKFRNRIMFPIADKKGKTIAFGGRVTDPNINPKYLNSPETEIFHKRRTLYALHLARKSIYDTGKVIVTEGYMDVIAMHQGGFKNTVSSLGTAITDEHLGLLWSLADEPIFCLDGDNAGIKAMHRVAYMALEHLQAGKSVRFAFLPKGYDPDDLIKEKGAGEMNAVLDKAIPLVDALWNIEKSAITSDTPEQKAAFEKRIHNLLDNIQDQTVRKYYSDTFKNRLWENRRGKSSSGTYYSGRSQTMPIMSAVKNTQEEAILYTIINHPALLHYRDVEEILAHVEFKSDKLKRILDIVISEEDFVDVLKKQGFEKQLHSATFYKENGELFEIYTKWKNRISEYQKKSHMENSKKDIIKDDLSQEEWDEFVKQLKQD